MIGSSYIPIVVPIMAFLAMFGWLGMVFYADSHPGYRRAKSEAAPGVQPVSAAAEEGLAHGREPEEQPAPGAAGPGDHERIEQPAEAAASR